MDVFQQLGFEEIRFWTIGVGYNVHIVGSLPADPKKEEAPVVHILIINESIKLRNYIKLEKISDLENKDIIKKILIDGGIPEVLIRK